LCLPELAIAETVCFCDFDEGVVGEDGFFEDVRFAVEFAGFFGKRGFGDCAVFVVAGWEFAAFDCGIWS